MEDRERLLEKNSRMIRKKPLFQQDGQHCLPSAAAINASLLPSLLVVFALFGLAVAHLSYAGDKRINLLRLDSVTVEHTTALKEERNQLKALTDDDGGSVSQFSVTTEAPLEIVFGFGEATVSPEQIVISLPKAKPKKGLAGSVEILVSSLSANAGFQSLRVDPLQARQQKQRFSFPPTAARWIMIRLTPATGATEMAVAEVAVLGYEGPPETHYAFKESPADALKVLARLQKTVDVSISPEEAALFEDAKDGQLDQWSFAEAALLASGVTDGAKRKNYLEQLAKHEGYARRLVARAKTPFEKGEKLLQWLHGRSMQGGYNAGQTDLSTLLDTGTFNCVSSATFYNVLGRRLGLDLRAIEVPDHAFSIIYDGTRHADVETTTVAGFNPARNRAAVDAFEKKTGFHYIPDRHRAKRREIGDAGLVAVTYYNHGVDLTREGKFYEALLAYFRALSLDPESASAVKNVLAVLANWSGKLADKGQFDHALDVISVGLELAPEDRTLAHNRKALWTQKVNALVEVGASDKALVAAREAHAAVPDGGFLRMQAWVFLGPAQALVKAARWEDALQLAESGLNQVDPEAVDELKKWQAGLFTRWAIQEIDERRFASAANVIGRGLSVYPNDRRLAHNLGYVAQEWAETVYQDEGDQKATAILTDLLQRYPEAAKVRNAAKAYVYRRISAWQAAGEFEAALTAIERYKNLLKDARDLRKVAYSVYDTQAEALSKKKDWQGAVAIYRQALEQYPNDRHLIHNAKATWITWGKTSIDAKDWTTASDIYTKALQVYPRDRTFKRNLGYIAQEWVREAMEKEGAEAAEAVLVQLLARFAKISEVQRVAERHVASMSRALYAKQRYEDAITVIERSKHLLKNDRKVTQFIRPVYDAWAQSYVQQKDWEQALTIYEKALKNYQNSHLKRNAVATWHAWAKTYLDDKDWVKAIAIYEKGLEQFPHERVFKNNVTYCQQQMGRR